LGVWTQRPISYSPMPSDQEFIDAFHRSMSEHRGAPITLFTTRIRELSGEMSATEQQAAMSEILDPLERVIAAMRSFIEGGFTRQDGTGGPDAA